MQIGEVASFQNGYAFKSKDFVQDGKYKIIKIKELKDGKVRFFNDSASVNVDDERIIEKYIVKKGDILFALTGDPVNKNNPLSWVGRVSVYEDDQLALLNQRVCKLVPKEGLNAKYIYYYFRAFNNFYALASIAKGSASQANISTKDIEAMEIALPSLNIQNKIVSVLDSIEEKINQNNEINKNLEEQIESFLIHALTSSETSINAHLGDYLYIKGRIGWKGLKKSEYLDHSDYRIINGESLTKSGIDWNKAGYISEERYSESPEIMLRVGDILLSKDGTIGKISYVNKLTTPTSVASGIFVIRNTKPDVISTPFIYYLLKSGLFKAFVAGRTEGSVIPHLYQKDFKEFEFPLPSADKMKEFDNLVTPLFQMVFLNLSENEWLVSLRDSLLPRLMSGEIDVSDLDL